MVWPQNLVACTLLNTLHAEEDNQSGGITRYKFFMITAVAAFVYYFLPGASFFIWESRVPRMSGALRFPVPGTLHVQLCVLDGAK